MSIGVRGAATVVVVAALVAPALAAEAPTPVSGRAIEVRPSMLTFDSSGRAIVSWSGLRGTDPDTTTTFNALASRPPGGAWRAGPPLPKTVLTNDVVTYGTGSAAVVTWRQEPMAHARSRSAVVLTLWKTGASAFGRSYRLDVGPPRRVTAEGPQPTVLLPKVASSKNGDVVVAWQRSDPESRAGVWVAERRPGGQLVKPRLLGVRGGESFLAIAPDGSGVLAWRRGHRLLARVRSVDRHWGPVRAVATAKGTQWAAFESVSVAAGGARFAVAAVQTDRSMAGVGIRVIAATAGADGPWRSAVLGHYTFVPTGQTAYVTDNLRAVAVLASGGRLRVVWPVLVTGHVRAAVSELAPAQHGTIAPAPKQLLSEPTQDVAIEDAARGPQGQLAAVWFDRNQNLAEVDATGAVHDDAAPGNRAHHGRCATGVQPGNRTADAGVGPGHESGGVPDRQRLAIAPTPVTDCARSRPQARARIVVLCLSSTARRVGAAIGLEVECELAVGLRAADQRASGAGCSSGSGW